MTHVCSVILIRRSFDIYHEQQKISLHNESILLLEKNLADDFAFCSPDTRRLDIDELTVCHYLQNIRRLLETSLKPCGNQVGVQLNLAFSPTGTESNGGKFAFASVCILLLIS